MANETKKICFVVGPIGDPGSETRRQADWLLRGIIEPVVREHFPDFEVQRADKIVAPGSINSQVINRLFDAPLVIVDMSGPNPNAFYEMGTRHMITHLPTVHMIAAGERIPFDVAPYRAIPFSIATPDDLETAKSALRGAVEEALKPDFEVDNPVTHARGVVKLEERASPTERVILDRLEHLEAQIAPRTGDQHLSLDAALEPVVRDWIIEARSLERRQFLKLIDTINKANLDRSYSQPGSTILVKSASARDMLKLRLQFPSIVIAAVPETIAGLEGWRPPPGSSGGSS